MLDLQRRTVSRIDVPVPMPLRTRSREWMIAIGKLRRYENTARRRRLPDWKIRILLAPEKVTREDADRMGNAAGISGRQVYKIREQNGKGRKR